MNPLHCTELGPDTLADYLKFFDTRAFSDNPRWAGCYCYFPLHDPATMNWQQRGGPENRVAVSSCVQTGTARGVLAWRDGEVVGWCNAGPWSQFPMLADESPPDAAQIGVIFCFVVAPEERGRGVAKALLDAACASFQRQGLTIAQARPTKKAETAAENHLGPLSMYLKAGFEVLREDADGDVYVRKLLT